jgi:2-polyprenyl-3-methyl-5-hydroxy-6-metoxy-1,4-benzoquinol methylase
MKIKLNSLNKNKNKNMKKLSTKNYNVTDLDPLATFERHVFHRDQFAHYFRWSHILKEIKQDNKVVDFGCGNSNLFEVLYRNRKRPSKYVGLDIRIKQIEKSNEKWKFDGVEFICEDLITLSNGTKLNELNGDIVCSFEVIEHVGKQNVHKFLSNFKECGNDNATFYLSTPNYDSKVGAADNHTYDSNDGRGIAVQEFSHSELEDAINVHFNVVKKWGTFASIRDYQHLMNDWQIQMFNNLKDYYDVNLLSNIMAPFFPEQSRNTLWVLNKK